MLDRYTSDVQLRIGHSPKPDADLDYCDGTCEEQHFTLHPFVNPLTGPKVLNLCTDCLKAEADQLADNIFEDPKAWVAALAPQVRKAVA